MIITWYEQPTRNPIGESLDLTWPEVIGLLKRSYHQGSKELAPGWAPHRLADGGTRKNEHVIDLCCLVLDVDHKGEADVSKVVAGTAGFARLIHSTASHTEGSASLRIVLPLAAPVPRDSWKEAWDAFALARGLAGLVDPLRDPARFYYVPTGPSGEIPEWDVTEGELLDLSKFQNVNKPKEVPTKSNNVPIADPAPVNLDQLRSRIAKGEWGKKLLKGEPLAESGGRHNAIRDAANEVARLAPEDTPQEALEELFAESFAAMDLEGIDAWHDLELALASARPWWAERRRERREAFEASRRSLLSKNAEAPEQVTEPLKDVEPAPKAADLPIIDAQIYNPDGTYTEAAITRWASDNQCTIDEFQKRWMIVHARSYWLFSEGRYLAPLDADTTEMKVHEVLAPAPVRLVNATEKDGMPVFKNRKLLDIRMDYGTAPIKVAASLEAPKSFYDAAEDRFVEALCPPRKITPKHHADVAEWLDLLVEDRRLNAKLLHWLATASQLGRPTSALYLWGPPSCGKSMLGWGIAKRWTHGNATKFDHFLGSFNSLIADCPIVVASEDLPESVGNITATIREMLGEGHFTMNRKFLPSVQVAGYPRLIITANDSAVFERLNESLTQAGVQAVAQRILVIEVSEKAAKYIKSRESIAHWAPGGDAIAEHIAHLAQTLGENPFFDGRWLVPGEMSAMHESLVIGGYTGALLKFMSRMFEKMDSKGEIPGMAGLVKLGNGELLIATKVFTSEDNWKRFVGSEYRQSDKAIGGALRDHLSVDGKPMRFTNTGPRFYKIRSEFLKLWIERNGMGDWESIQMRINEAKTP